MCRNQGSDNKLIFDETCLEMPVLPCLGDDCSLFTERVSGIVPSSSVPIRYIINEEFSSHTEDYCKYIQFHGKNDLNEVSQRNKCVWPFAFFHTGCKYTHCLI